MNSRRLGIVVIIVLCLCLFMVVRNTYSKYNTVTTSDNKVKVAKWLVKVNDSVITSNDHEFDLGEIAWDNNGVEAAPGTIAPGMSGTISIVIDASDTNVLCDYEIIINKDKLPEYITLDNMNEYTGSLKMNEVKTIKLKIAWKDTETDNDIGINSQEFKIPVTVNVKQHIN